MSTHSLVAALESQKTMFDRSTGALEEADSGFAPVEGMFTAAQHVAHVAQSLDWFIEGAFERADGPDANFEDFNRLVLKVTSLTEARAWLERSWTKAARVLASKSDDELNAPIPGEILGNAPKRSIVDMNGDHTAHHRGALTTYARLLGKTPPMPYM